MSDQENVPSYKQTRVRSSITEEFEKEKVKQMLEKQCDKNGKKNTLNRWKGWISERFSSLFHSQGT